jgi:hypothetical protein
MDNYDEFETQIYFDRAPAEAAVERLHALGYQQDEIGIMMDDATREKAFAAVVNAKGSEGLATGGVIGGILGAIVAGVTATGSVAAIAGTGGLATPLVAGPLVAALAGLGVGATGGGILGGLIGLGVGENRAKQYEKGLRAGGILVAVRPKGKIDRDQVRRAMSNERAMTGEIDNSVDYAGEYDRGRTR